MLTYWAQNYTLSLWPVSQRRWQAVFGSARLLPCRGLAVASLSASILCSVALDILCPSSLWSIVITMSHELLLKLYKFILHNLINYSVVAIIMKYFQQTDRKQPLGSLRWGNEYRWLLNSHSLYMNIYNVFYKHWLTSF